MSERVIIGIAPYSLSMYGGDAAALVEAVLQAGYRWLTFPEGGWSFNRGINLDLFSGANNSLVLEGPGPYLAQLNRAFSPDTSPLLYCEHTGWDIHMSGMMFADVGNLNSNNPKPLVWLRTVGGSYIKNTNFEDGSGDGLRLGPDYAAIFTLIAPKAYHNKENGIHIDNGLCVAAFSTMAERNDNADSRNGAQIRLRGTTQAARGAGSFLSTHVETHGQPRGIVVDRWRALRIAGGYFLEGGVSCSTTATENIVEGVSMRGSEISFVGASNVKRCYMEANACGN